MIKKAALLALAMLVSSQAIAWATTTHYGDDVSPLGVIPFGWISCFEIRCT